MAALLSLISFVVWIITAVYLVWYFGKVTQLDKFGKEIDKQLDKMTFIEVENYIKIIIIAIAVSLIITIITSLFF